MEAGSFEHLIKDCMKGSKGYRQNSALRCQKPALHIHGSFSGKGDDQDLPGRYMKMVDQIGNSMGNGKGLTGAGACQYQHGPRSVHHSLTLRFI